MKIDLKLTFTATDDEVTVDAAEAASDDVVSLSLTSVLSGQSPSVQIVQMDFLRE